MFLPGLWWIGDKIAIQFSALGKSKGILLDAMIIAQLIGTTVLFLVLPLILNQFNKRLEVKAR